MPWLLSRRWPCLHTTIDSPHAPFQRTGVANKQHWQYHHVACLVQVLQQTHGAMELVDVSADLAELKRCPGRTTWEVKDRTGWNAAYDEGLNQVCCLLCRTLAGLRPTPAGLCAAASAVLPQSGTCWSRLSGPQLQCLSHVQHPRRWRVLRP